MSLQTESKLAGIARVDVAMPEDLETPRAKLTYLALEVTGPATLDHLQAALDEDKLTLLSVLDTLTSAGHVERERDGRYAVC